MVMMLQRKRGFLKFLIGVQGVSNTRNLAGLAVSVLIDIEIAM